MSEPKRQEFEAYVEEMGHPTSGEKYLIVQVIEIMDSKIWTAGDKVRLIIELKP
jgi:hypothetical protein